MKIVLTVQLLPQDSLKKVSPELLEFILIKSLLTSSVSTCNPVFLLLFERSLFCFLRGVWALPTYEPRDRRESGWASRRL